jgi:signal transduction histidine kinase
MNDELESLTAPHEYAGVVRATTENQAQSRPQTDADGAVREDVLAQVSHDLRVPLQAITTTVEEMKHRRLDATKFDRKLAIIERSTRRMAHLVDDLLDVALIRQGTLVLCRQPARMEDLIAEALEMLSGPAEQKRIHVEYRAPESPIPLRCDEERVLRLLTNLIGNAIKFTPHEGRIVIQTRNLQEAVKVQVSDSGPGIAKHEQEVVFEPFRTGRRTQASGLGLGLHIARAIAEAHGGRIDVESVLGDGTTFSFVLPHQLPTAPDPIAAELSPPADEER